jgi:signal transduction histidine kinase
MVVMWVFMILVWRVLSRVLRRFGRWAVLVPVTAMGAAVFGLNVWTAGTVVLALILAALLALTLAARRAGPAGGRPGPAGPADPGGAAGRPGPAALLPLMMVAAGVCGLWAAVTTLLPWGTNSVSVLQAAAGLGPVPGGPAKLAGQGFTSPGKGSGQAFASPGKGDAVVTPIPKPSSPAQFAALQNARRQLAQAYRRQVARGSTVSRVSRPLHPVVHGPPLWWGRMLLLGSLLLLAVGLWLLPRALSDLRTWLEPVTPRLRRWVREGNWGILLPPVTALGLTMFGVRPWTVAAVVAAVILAIVRPRLAADLVPLVLVFFALYGFMLVSRLSGPRAFMTPTQFGAVDVDSVPTSVLAGMEASVLLAFAAWLFPRTIGAHARTKTATGHEVELAGRVQRLTETRGHAVDSAAAELRRIERDLHDGAQARLVALGMNLRALERMLPASPDAARELAAEAIQTSARALRDLRLLVRGIYPPVLADRGLSHAVRALALDTALPVDLDVDVPGRLSAPVESACYFAVAEALANAVKHSGARRIHVRIQHAAGMLRIEVADDGAGGADPARGTGLRGVERRLGTFDGILAVSSPPGGPTMIAMEVPCELSSPKTYSCSGTG